MKDNYVSRRSVLVGVLVMVLLIIGTIVFAIFNRDTQTVLSPSGIHPATIPVAGPTDEGDGTDGEGEITGATSTGVTPAVNPPPKPPKTIVRSPKKEVDPPPPPEVTAETPPPLDAKAETPPPPPIYKCPICSKTFTSKKELIAHSDSHLKQ